MANALAMLNDMMSSHESPDIGCFNSVLQLCGEAGSVDVAVGVYQSMLRTNVHPNALTYTSIIDACVHGCDARRALALVQARAWDGMG